MPQERSLSESFGDGSSSGPYKCGVPLAPGDQTAFVQQEYRRWKKKYVRSFDGGRTSCVVRPKGDKTGMPSHPVDCVSEGIGYGMLIAAYVEDREVFQALWAFSQKYLNSDGLMGWQIWPGHEDEILGAGGATDADEDVAMALLVAADRWGGEYGQLAREQIDRVFQHEVQARSGVLLPGDQWGSCQSIDPSYFAPAWYRAFGAATDNPEAWQRVIDWGFQLLAKCNGYNSGTGLTPQWTDCECAPRVDDKGHDRQYWCDSVRVPWRMGMSAAWHCEERALHQARLLSQFFSAQGAASIQNGYTLDGQPIHATETSLACTEMCFVVTAASALVAGSSDEGHRAAFWNETARVPDATQSCYFCDALRLLSLLFTSGMMTEPRVHLYNS